MTPKRSEEEPFVRPAPYEVKCRTCGKKGTNYEMTLEYETGRFVCESCKNRDMSSGVKPRECEGLDLRV